MTKALLFDLDGTLLDTAPDFFTVMNRLRAEESLAPMTFSALRQTVSNGSPGMLKASFGMESNHTDYEPLKKRFLDCYMGNLAHSTTLFPGIEALLKAWEATGQPWGIVTNKPTWLAKPLVEQLSLSKRCSTLVCGDTLPVKKPDPAPLLLAAKEINVPASDCYYIGDHVNDIKAAQSANMTSVAAGYGYLAPNDNPASWQANFQISTPTQLHKLLADVTDCSL